MASARFLLAIYPQLSLKTSCKDCSALMEQSQKLFCSLQGQGFVFSPCLSPSCCFPPKIFLFLPFFLAQMQLGHSGRKVLSKMHQNFFKKAFKGKLIFWGYPGIRFVRFFARHKEPCPEFGVRTLLTLNREQRNVTSIQGPQFQPLLQRLPLRCPLTVSLTSAVAS